MPVVPHTHNIHNSKSDNHKQLINPISKRVNPFTAKTFEPVHYVKHWTNIITEGGLIESGGSATFNLETVVSGADYLKKMNLSMLINDIERVPNGKELKPEIKSANNWQLRLIGDGYFVHDFQESQINQINYITLCLPVNILCQVTGINSSITNLWKNKELKDISSEDLLNAIDNLEEHQFPAIYSIMHSSGIYSDEDIKGEVRNWNYVGEIKLERDNWYLGKNGVLYIFSNILDFSTNDDNSDLLEGLTIKPALMLKPMSLSMTQNHIAGTIYYNTNDYMSDSVKYLNRNNILAKPGTNSINSISWQQLQYYPNKNATTMVDKIGLPSKVFAIIQNNLNEDSSQVSVLDFPRMVYKDDGDGSKWYFEGNVSNGSNYSKFIKSLVDYGIVSNSLGLEATFGDYDSNPEEFYQIYYENLENKISNLIGPSTYQEYSNLLENLPIFFSTDEDEESEDDMMVVKVGTKFSHLSATDIVILLQKFILNNFPDDNLIITTTTNKLEDDYQYCIDLTEEISDNLDESAVLDVDMIHNPAYSGLPNSNIDSVNQLKYSPDLLIESFPSTSLQYLQSYAPLLIGDPQNTELNGGIVCTDDIGCALIRVILFKHNGYTIEKLTGSWIDIQNKIRLSSELKETIQKQQSNLLNNESVLESYISVTGLIKSPNNIYNEEDQSNTVLKTDGGQKSSGPIQMNIPFWFTESIEKALPINLVAEEQTITVEIEFAAQEDTSLIHYRTLNGAERNYRYNAVDVSNGNRTQTYRGAINSNIFKSIQLDCEGLVVEEALRKKIENATIIQKVTMVDNMLLTFGEYEINHLCKYPTIALIWSYLEKDGDSGPTRTIDNWATDSKQSWNQYGSHENISMTKKNRKTDRRHLNKNINKLINDVKIMIDSEYDKVTSSIAHHSTNSSLQHNLNCINGVFMQVFGEKLFTNEVSGDTAAGCYDKSIRIVSNYKNAYAYVNNLKTMEVMVYALFNKKIIYSPGKIKFEEEFECNHMESKGN